MEANEQLIYLVIVVSTGTAAVPVISLAMIGAVYGLQVSYSRRTLILSTHTVTPLTLGHHFHHQARVHAGRLDDSVHLGVSTLERDHCAPLTSSFPVYSLFLPVYSFWSMDDFSWGNTRYVEAMCKSFADPSVKSSEREIRRLYCTRTTSHSTIR